MSTTTTPTPPRLDLRESLETVLHRPVTDAEVSRAYRIGQAAERLLREAQGPVPVEVEPTRAVALGLVPVVARVLEGGVLEVTDEDRRRIARYAGAMRPPHPFLRGY